MAARLEGEAIGERGEMLLRARSLVAARRRREEVLPPELFGEPAWDILLDLLVAHLEGRSRTLDEAAAVAGIGEATASRWAEILRAQGLADLTPGILGGMMDGISGRGLRLSLTPRGITAMTSLVIEKIRPDRD